MPEAITLRYHSTQRDLTEAMMAAGRAIGKNNRDWPFLLSSVLAIWLASLGGLAIGSLIWIWVFDRSGSSLPWMAAGFAFGFLTLQFAFRRMIWVQAGMLLQSRFGGLEQRMKLNPEGVTLFNDTAQWFTSWHGVERVLSTKSGLAIVVSGITLPVPNAAFEEGGPGKAQVFDQCQDWLAAGQP